LALQLRQLRRIALLEHLAILGDFIDSLLAAFVRCSLADGRGGGVAALFGRVLASRHTRQQQDQPRRPTSQARERIRAHAIVVSSERESPLLSVQLMRITSPFCPPLNMKDKNGLADTACPHCAASTVRSACVASTVWMKCAGIASPASFLRNPVSIGWLINTFTSTMSPIMRARIFMGFAIVSLRIRRS